MLARLAHDGDADLGQGGVGGHLLRIGRADPGSFELLPGARERLAKVSGIVLAYPSLHVAIEGHTDSIGSDDYNQQLSERRAQAVRDYFVQQGINSSAVEARGYG